MTPSTQPPHECQAGPPVSGSAAESGPAGAADSPAEQRLRSLDAYRGLIMVLLAFVGFGLREVAENQLEQAPNSGFWSGVAYQFSHAQWVGCSLWDMIQPSFMFMVGVAMAFSYAKRQRLGQSYSRMLLHALWRSVVLILLGVFLMSNWSKSTNWSFVNVLTQIGLGYTFLFLVRGWPAKFQAIAATAVLVGTWLLFVLYPGAGIDIAAGAPEVGVEPQWAQQHLEGVPPAWHKNTNVGHAIDVPLLNLFRSEDDPFEFNGGGYQTINFLPSLATMIFGLMCGELLRSNRSHRKKLLILLAAGIGGLVVGQVLHATGVCPIVKRIWTPSWAIFSTGWCCLILAALFGVIDVLRWRLWAFPLVVVGMNSIAMYLMFQLLRPWTAKTLQIHLGDNVFEFCGDVWAPAVQATMVGFCLWLICLWLYRQKFFIRV
jgi:predicted acyltransferase